MIRTLFATVLLLALLSAPVSAADFVLDKAHTEVEFVIGDSASGKVLGKIPLVSGTATIGADNLPTAVSATFDVASLRTQSAVRDKDLRDNYFEVTQYPTITFVERQAQGTSQAFIMTGDLTIHGVTRAVTLTAKVNRVAIVKGKKHIAFTGATTINLHRQFDVTFSPLLDDTLIAGGGVMINIETDAVEQ